MAAGWLQNRYFPVTPLPYYQVPFNASLIHLEPFGFSKLFLNCFWCTWVLCYFKLSWWIAAGWLQNRYSPVTPLPYYQVQFNASLIYPEPFLFFELFLNCFWCTWGPRAGIIPRGPYVCSYRFGNSWIHHRPTISKNMSTQLSDLWAKESEISEWFPGNLGCSI